MITADAEVTLHVRLFEDGAVRELSSDEFALVEFTSMAWSVADVDDDGVVTGGGTPGEGSIRVDDGVHGAAFAQVRNVAAADFVADEIVGVVFAVPVVSGEVGDNLALSDIMLLRADGSRVLFDSGDFGLVVDDDTIATLDGSTVQLLAEGSAFVRAVRRSNNTLLAGGVNVVSVPAGSFANVTCSAQPVFVGCRIAEWPDTFGSPGLSAPLEVYKYFLVPGAGCLDLPFMQVERSSPDDVVVSRADVVVAGSAGSVRSNKVGFTSLTLKVQEQSCGSVQSFVYPDLVGEWSATCENGDEGQLFVSNPWPRPYDVFVNAIDSPFAGAGASQSVHMQHASFDSCFTGDAFSCENALQQYRADWDANGVLHPGVGYACGNERHEPTAGGFFRDDGTFHYGSCDYVPSLTNAECGDERTFTFDGTTYPEDWFGCSLFLPVDGGYNFNFDCPTDNDGAYFYLNLQVPLVANGTYSLDDNNGPWACFSPCDGESGTVICEYQTGNFRDDGGPLASGTVVVTGYEPGARGPRYQMDVNATLYSAWLDETRQISATLHCP